MGGFEKIEKNDIHSLWKRVFVGFDRIGGKGRFFAIKRPREIPSAYRFSVILPPPRLLKMTPEGTAPRTKDRG